MEKINIEKSKKGFPCLWECGGSFSNTGEATIIADRNGNKKQAIFIRNKGNLACENHALIPVEKNDYIIKCNHNRTGVMIKIFKIVDITSDKAILEENYFEEKLYKACEAAKNKAYDYHCRTTYYVN